MTSPSLPRRLLATAGLAGVLAAGGTAITTGPAFAATPTAASSTPVAASSTSGSDDTGKWGLAGLTGMLGLFGYRKYQANRAAKRTTGDVGAKRR